MVMMKRMKNALSYSILKKKHTIKYTVSKTKGCISYCMLNLFFTFILCAPLLDFLSLQPVFLQ